MLNTLIMLAKTFFALLILSIAAYLIMDNYARTKATAFCNKEVVIGKSSADLIEKAKKAGAKPYIADSKLRGFVFTGSARPVFCYVTVTAGVVTEKQAD